MKLKQLNLISKELECLSPTQQTAYSGKFSLLWNYHKPTLNSLKPTFNTNKKRPGLAFRLSSRTSTLWMRRAERAKMRSHRVFATSLYPTNMLFVRRLADRSELTTKWPRASKHSNTHAPTLSPHHQITLWHPIFLFQTASWDLLGFSHHATRWIARHHQTSLTKPYVYPKDFPVLDKRVLSPDDASRGVLLSRTLTSISNKAELFNKYLRSLTDTFPVEILRNRKHNPTELKPYTYQRFRRLKWPTTNFLRDIGVSLPNRSRPPVFRFLYLQRSLLHSVVSKDPMSNFQISKKFTWLRSFARRLPVKPTPFFKSLRRQVLSTSILNARYCTTSLRLANKPNLGIDYTAPKGTGLKELLQFRESVSRWKSGTVRTDSATPLATINTTFVSNNSYEGPALLNSKMTILRTKWKKVLRSRPKTRSWIMRYRPSRSILKVLHSSKLISFYTAFHQRSSLPRRRRNLALRWLTGHFKVPGQKDYTNLILPNFFLRRQFELNVSPRHESYFSYFIKKIDRPITRFNVIRRLSNISRELVTRAQVPGNVSVLSIIRNPGRRSRCSSPTPTHLNLAAMPPKAVRPQYVWSTSEFSSPVGEIKLKPLASTFFTRSPFFFTALINLHSSARSDFLAVRSQRFGADSRLPVFPIRNRMKIAVFRQLTFSKQMFLDQMTTFSVFRDVVNPSKRKKRGSTLHSSRSNVKSFLPNSLGASNRYKLGGWTSDWITETFSRNFDLEQQSQRPRNPIEYEARVGRIRFKPGYGRIWRNARLEIQPLISVYAKYQYRLTTRLQTYFFSHRHITSRKIHMVLEDTLIMATFTTDRWVTREFLANNLVFLNGVTCVNPRAVLFMGDLVQMLINLKFYIARRWVEYWTSLRLNRIQKIFHRKNKPLGFDRTIYRVRELPEWFYTVRFTYSEIPKIFELDFFTLSFFVIHDRLTNETAFQKRLLRFPNHIVNMYNWKYIT